MQPMIEIHYINGRIRRIPDTAFLAEGENMTGVIDIAFEDAPQGLVVYYKHYEPVRASSSALDIEPDPAGLPSVLYNDGYVVLIEKEDMQRVEKVYYEGKLELYRFSPAGELVNLHKVNSAQMLYLNEQGDHNMRLKIAELFTEMRKAFHEKDSGFSTEAQIDEAVRKDLGVSKAIVEECLSFQSSYALSNASYAIEHGLPYVDEEGVLVNPSRQEGAGAYTDTASEFPALDTVSNSREEDDVESMDYSI